MDFVHQKRQIFKKSYTTAYENALREDLTLELFA